MGPNVRVLFVVVASLLRCLPAWGQSAFEAEILAAHNAYREAVQVPLMSWDPALAADASDWAMRLGRTEVLRHCPCDAREAEGENLWIGTAGSYSVAEMVREWGDERRNYQAGYVPDVSRTGRFAAVAHYTQMVWRETRRVGCGMSRVAEKDILVCRYATEGNVMGQLVY